MAEFIKSLPVVLKHEGGYVNDPDDPGGMTNLGVTKRAWDAFTEHDATESDMRALDTVTVAPFYKQKYWDKLGVLCGSLDDMEQDYATSLFDYGVNTGLLAAKRAHDIAQGDTSALFALKVSHYHDLVSMHPRLARYYNGWINRAESFNV